jgi:hypothetical protein
MSIKPKYNNFPLKEVRKAVVKQLKQHPNYKFYQKFTCAGCGERLGIDEPNKFYTKGNCDNCSTITDIKKDGCNYMVVMEG